MNKIVDRDIYYAGETLIEAEKSIYKYMFKKYKKEKLKDFIYMMCLYGHSGDLENFEEGGIAKNYECIAYDMCCLVLFKHKKYKYISKFDQDYITDLVKHVNIKLSKSNRRKLNSWKKKTHRGDIIVNWG